MKTDAGTNWRSLFMNILKQISVMGSARIVLMNCTGMKSGTGKEN